MKQRTAKKVSVFFLMAFLISSCAVGAERLFAQNATELRDKIDQKNTDIQRLEAEIANYQKQITAVGKEATSLAGEVKKLDLTRAKLKTDIAVTENKIDATNLTIQKLSLQIGDKEETIGENKDAISSSMRKLNELSSNTILESVLGGTTLSEVWNEVQNLQTFQEQVRKHTNDLKDAKRTLEDNRAETEAAKKELLALKAELADQKLIVDQNTNQKNKLLADTKNQESNYKALLASRLAQKTALEKEIADYESQLKFILDPKTLPKAGVFSWPLDKIIITQQFGKTSDSGRLYASGTHNGTDFGTPVGTPVKAMSSGTVVGVGDTDKTCPGASFGKWVLIKYNNGLASTYGHLSLIKAAAGDKVAAGSVVGYSGNTGYSTGPHLHVSVYVGQAVQVQSLPSKACGGRIYTMPIAATNAYLDPLVYLPKLR